MKAGKRMCKDVCRSVSTKLVSKICFNDKMRKGFGAHPPRTLNADKSGFVAAQHHRSPRSNHGVALKLASAALRSSLSAHHAIRSVTPTTRGQYPTTRR